MPSFVVETFVPSERRERFALAIDELRTAAERTAGREIRHVRSFLLPGDEMGFHVIEARSASDVERLAVAVGIEAERIVEFVGLEIEPREGPA